MLPTVGTWAMSQTLFLKSSLTEEGQGAYFIPSHMAVERKENVYRKILIRQLWNHSCEVLCIWNVELYPKSFADHVFIYILCLLLGMSLLILREGYLTMFEEPKYFMSSFCHSCMLYIYSTPIDSLTPIHVRFMCTDICHAKWQNISSNFDQIGCAINKSTYWHALVDKGLITVFLQWQN